MIVSRLSEENIDFQVKLSTFFDDEILDWNTFTISFKPISEYPPIDYVMSLWDDFSGIKKTVFKMLQEFILVTKTEINALKQKIILTLEVD